MQAEVVPRYLIGYHMQMTDAKEYFGETRRLPHLSYSGQKGPGTYTVP